MQTYRALLLFTAAALLTACTARAPQRVAPSAAAAVPAPVIDTLEPPISEATDTPPAKLSPVSTPVPLTETSPKVVVQTPVSETAIEIVPTSFPSLTNTPPSTSTTFPTETATSHSTAVPATATAVPATATIEPATATDEPVVLSESGTVNGVDFSEIVIMPDAVRSHVQYIFLEGQQVGRNAHAFSKLGDSVTLTDHYLTRFDSGNYDLGPYAFLQPAIEFYRGSFERYGVATKVGLHAWSIFDPLWANKEWCLPEEDMVACEIRLHNPSVLLIKIGSNDSGAATSFEQNLRLLLEYSISSGVIPILGTKADRFEGPDDRNNGIIRRLAQEYAVPLWDYDRIAGTLPRRGLSGDDVHMTMADADDYTKSETFERGYPVSDLTALATLYEVMREVTAVNDA